MLTAHEVQAFLRQFEPLKEVHCDPLSDVIDTSWLVKVHGNVSIYGDVHGFEVELDLRNFGGGEDLMKLAAQLLKSFAVAGEALKTVSL